MAYPIADLRALTGGDVVRYVWGLEESVIRVLADLGIVAGRDAQHRGVWVGARYAFGGSERGPGNED